MKDIQKKIASLPPEKRELFELMLQEQGVDLSEIMITPAPRDQKTYPLSFSQQRLWFLHRMDPDSPLYNITSVIRMRGELQIKTLEHCFNLLMQRHEVLRTAFREEDGHGRQEILPELKLEIPVVDLTNTETSRIDTVLNEYAVYESLQPFDLSQTPLIRVKLLRFGEKHHVLILVMHHIVSDNWSTGLIVHEILEMYKAYAQNKEPQLPELPVQYADFAVWQRKWLKGKTLEKQLQYWRDRLQDTPPVLEMPLDRPRPAYQTYNGAYLTFHFTADTQKALHQLSRKADTTLFMTLLAAFEALLHRYSGQNDILTGTPIANRNRSETEHLIGFFVNTLVLRADFSDNPTFNQLLKRVKDDTLGAYQHQDIPFETLVEKLQPERDMSHSPFFQAMFVLNNAPVEQLQLPDLTLELIEVENKTAKFDLILNALEDDTGIHFKLEYNTDLFNADTMERFAEHYRNIVNAVLSDPDQAVSDPEIMSDAEKNRIFDEFSQPDQQFTANTNLIDLFRKQVQKNPDKEALRAGETSLTYSELERRSNQLAHYLLTNGLQKESIVGVYGDRSVDTITALLAVLKAGAVYLPLDPDYPGDRIAYMLEDSGAMMVLTLASLSNELPGSGAKTIVIDEAYDPLDKEDTSASPIQLEPDAAAYIIYTSGSTGQPKGVVVEHGAIADHCLDMADHFALTEDDRVLQFAALNFDASLEQIFPTLISGATLVMRENEIWPTDAFHKKVQEHQLSVINLPTAYWAALADEWHRDSAMTPGALLRLVIVGGDVLEADALQKWQSTAMNKVRLLNAYGPTETIITASTFEIPPDFMSQSRYSRIPIGRPRANRTFYVLDRRGKPVPTGVPGELHIGGTALAQGYLNRKTLTEERFIADPIAGKGRMYRSGDRVRFLPDGQLEFLGRVDAQVKIRGFRIEPGEIESLLRSHEQINNAVVVVHKDANEDKRLAAYFVPEDGASFDVTALRQYLQKQLPEYMIPSHFVELESIPLDPSGKINRRALPDPVSAGITSERPFVEPRTDTERYLAEIVKNLLNLEKVGVHDNFFEIGGHSMMATQVVSRIRETFDVEVSLRALFENPTVKGIAEAILEAQTKDQDEESLTKMLDDIEQLSGDELDQYLKNDD